MKTKKIYLYPFLFLLYSLYSYTRVEPNLVLSSHPLFWSFQQFMWQLGFVKTHLAALIFFLLIFFIFFTYIVLFKPFQPDSQSPPNLKQILILCLLALSVSYPALSHDVFNYAFNAKMVLKYHANPHQQTALEYSHDPWVSYMHNTHTKAPYAWGWTLISLIPASFAGNHIKLALLFFRLLMLLFLFLILRLHRAIDPQSQTKSLIIFALNPLILIESIANIHNDLVMMFFALSSVFVLVKKPITRKSSINYIIALSLFLLSVSIKYATIAILGGLILFIILKTILHLQSKKLNLNDIISLSLFTPLLTSRSQRFLPWYLSWPLSFLPLGTSTIWRHLLLIFSASSLFSYLPHIYFNQYTSTQQLIRQAIIFIPALVYLAYRLIVFFINYTTNPRT